MPKLFTFLFQGAALAFAPAAAFAQTATAAPNLQPGLYDARGKFSVAGLACDQQNSGQPWAPQVGKGPDGSQLVRHEIRARWRTSPRRRGDG